MELKLGRSHSVTTLATDRAAAPFHHHGADEGGDGIGGGEGGALDHGGGGDGITEESISSLSAQESMHMHVSNTGCSS